MQGSALFVAEVAGAGCSILTPAGLLPPLDADRSPQAVTRARHPGEPRISRCISYSQRTKTRERDDAFQHPFHPRPSPVPPPGCPHTSEGAPAEGACRARTPPRRTFPARCLETRDLPPAPAAARVSSPAARRAHWLRQRRCGGPATRGAGGRARGDWRRGGTGRARGALGGDERRGTGGAAMSGGGSR